MILIQPLAMYLFLRVLEYGFFASAGLAALVTLFVGFAIYRIQAGAKNNV